MMFSKANFILKELIQVSFNILHYQTDLAQIISLKVIVLAHRSAIFSILSTLVIARWSHDQIQIAWLLALYFLNWAYNVD